MTLDTHSMLDMDVERRLGGAGPFAINLHASTAPIGLPTKGPSGSEHARLYQIQRIDDGRIRYRLRLGPFATEDEAEATLAQVRVEYPGALTVTAAADDLHAIALARGKTNSFGSSADTPPMTAAPVAQAPAVAAAAPAVVAPVVAAAAPAVVAVPAPVVAAPAPAVVAVPAPVVAAPAPVASVPAPPPAAVSVASDIASMQALIAAIDTDIDTAPSTAAPGNMTPKPPVLRAVPAAKATAGRDVANVGTTAPPLESTQTLRPLTPLELGEHEAPRWFVVQLGLSDGAFDPDALPHLDIFSLYRLYTVNGMDRGRPVHALRLGFFAEEVGARAVAGYLAAFYHEAAVKRVSVAERDRFADQRVEARKDVGATGRHLAIEITNELVVRGRRSSL
jgi:hypothetical protein